MPAMLDDPSSPTIYRTSGSAPFPNPHDPQPTLPVEVYPRQVTLRDRVTTATIVPFSSQHQVPQTLLTYLSDQLNKEIENGDTYPMIDTMPVEKFAAYWFQNFGAVMLMGNIDSADDLLEDNDWSKVCLGSYYIKPNYPGRSSHVCNAGFLVTDAARNKGVGRLMGESYLEWAPKIGYTYSVFNLVYETNVASCRIWDALGFKRIGRVKGAGNLKSYPGQLIDAIIYGRDLGPEGEDFVSEERFDKIKFYLKYGKYPAGADRAEKSRLRSAATHYKLLPDSDKLMLKDKEVISDPQRQYEIARTVHVGQHGGINKTTATIAEKYHWVRIKETVSLVIRNCAQCKELGKAPVVRADGVIRPAPRLNQPQNQNQAASAAGRALTIGHPDDPDPAFANAGRGSISPQVLNRSLPQNTTSHHHSKRTSLSSHLHRSQSASQSQSQSHSQSNSPSAPIARMHTYLPLDPQIMSSLSYPPSPSHANDPSHDFNEQDSFQAMLAQNRDGEEGDGDGDLDMLIHHDNEEEVDGEGEEEGSIEDMDVLGGNHDILQMRAEATARAQEALRVGRGGG